MAFIERFGASIVVYAFGLAWHCCMNTAHRNAQ